MVRDGYIYALSLLAVAACLRGSPASLAGHCFRSCWRRFSSGFSAILERAIPTGEGLVVSPGDGLVTETASITTPEGARQRISIFLSVFDVHVNRAPIGGIVSRVRYEKGKFLNAMNPASAERNEQNAVTVRGQGADAGFEVTFKQIAGLLARRIVCRCKEGETVERGQRVGLIKFGSRVDVVLPADAVLRVKVGERVKGGASVLAAACLTAETAGVDPLSRGEP